MLPQIYAKNMKYLHRMSRKKFGYVVKYPQNLRLIICKLLTLQRYVNFEFEETAR